MTGSIGTPRCPEPAHGTYGIPGMSGSPLGGCLGMLALVLGTMSRSPQTRHSILYRIAASLRPYSQQGRGRNSSRLDEYVHVVSATKAAPTAFHRLGEKVRFDVPRGLFGVGIPIVPNVRVAVLTPSTLRVVCNPDSPRRIDAHNTLYG